MELSVAQSWMIAVSIETKCQRHGWSRTTDKQVQCRSALGRQVQRLWRECAWEHEASEDWRAHLWRVLNGGFKKWALLQRFKPTGDAESSRQVVQSTRRYSSRVDWGTVQPPVTGKQWSGPVAEYCAAVVVCRSTMRQFAWHEAASTDPSQ